MAQTRNFRLNKIMNHLTNNDSNIVCHPCSIINPVKKELVTQSFMDLRLSLRNKIKHMTVDKTAITIYDMPLSFNYHGHKFIFYSIPSLQKLKTFHTELQKHKISIYERYGWYPNIKQRIKIDLNTCLIGIVINIKNQDIMAMITLYDITKTKTKKYKYEKEISLCVLPQYQRCHIATDLVRLTWCLFADSGEECWVYVMNSTKSGMFWRIFKQWYPTINFRLVRP
eukprot:299628_1